MDEIKEYKKFSFRLPANEHKLLKKIAFDDDTSINAILLKLVKDYLATKSN